MTGFHYTFAVGLGLAPAAEPLRERSTFYRFDRDSVKQEISAQTALRFDEEIMLPSVQDAKRNRRNGRGGCARPLSGVFLQRGHDSVARMAPVDRILRAGIPAVTAALHRLPSRTQAPPEGSADTR